jgi:hypothetical protein
MKNIIFLLTFLFSIVCFGQNDSEKVYTFAKNNLKITGLWDYISSNEKNEHFVSHCPLFINDNKTIFEMAKWDKSSIKNSKNLDILNKAYLKSYKKLDRIILSSEISENGDYYLYKLSVKSKTNFEKPVDIYTLIGLKNDFVYSFATYNYEHENECGFEFLKEQFYNN